MRKVLAYLFNQTPREKLPRLPHTLAEEFDPLELDSDIRLALMTGLVRDPHEARKLMVQYGAKNGAELLARLPPPPPVDWRKRLQAWIRQLEGGYQSDPHKEELRRREEGML